MARSVLAGRPDDASVLSLLALAELKQNKHSPALHSARAAIAADPENDWPHRLAALSLHRMGRYAEAAQHARQAMSLAPNTAYGYILLALALSAGGMDPAEAADAADRAVTLAPHLADAHLAVGDVALAASRLDDAEDSFRRALDIDPENAAAHNELARVQLKRRRFGHASGLARATTGLATAIRLDPQSEVSRRNLDIALNLFMARAAAGIMLVAFVASHGLFAQAKYVAALLLLIPVGLAVRFVLGLPPTLRRYLWLQVRRPLVGSAAALDVIAVGLLVAGSFAPGNRSPYIFLGSWIVAGAAILLWSRSRKLLKNRGKAKS